MLDPARFGIDTSHDPLEEEGWALATPTPGWTVAHQIAHLTATFRMAGLAASDPAGFRRPRLTAWLDHRDQGAGHWPSPAR